MNSNSYNLNELLTTWGKSQQTLPAQSELLKNQLLAKLQPAVPQPRKLSLKNVWLPWALSGLAVFLFVIQLSKIGTPALQAPSILEPTSRQKESSTLKVAPQNQGFIAQNLPKDKSAIDDSKTVTAPYAADSLRVGESNGGSEIYTTPPAPSGAVPSTDNREYLKTSYSANISSRRVMETTERVQTIVRGFDGRVDSASEAEDHGYVSFVVLANKFDAFKNELKNLAGEKFIIQTEQSDNLLPQKQDLETQQAQNQKTLDQLNADKQNLTNSHNKTVSSINGQIGSINKQLNDLQIQLQQHPEQWAQISAQQQTLQNQKASWQRKLADENDNYSYQLSSFESQIKNAQDNLTELSGQTNQLLDNVQTVQGTIYVNYISWWSKINTYAPVGWIMLGIVLIALASLIWQQRNRKIAIP
jgi:hypothetical protein